MSRLPTPPSIDSTPRLVLCADGGGSKVCVVIRSEDGVEARGTAGPCNVQSVGFTNAAQAILLATYRALKNLPRSHIPRGLVIPDITEPTPLPSAAVTPPDSPGPSSTSISLSDSISFGYPAINIPIFAAAWLALAGVNTAIDAQAFSVYPPQILNIPPSRVNVTNDVNLLAAPALAKGGVDHVVAVVAGTGTVGRTLRIDREAIKGQTRTLPLEDVGYSRGWGYLLCDEGSAFWTGRLAARMLLRYADRQASSRIYSSSTPDLLPFHQELLDYFGVESPMDVIELVTHNGRWLDPIDNDASKVASRRNAMLAGSARLVLKWAFPEDGIATRPPTPPIVSTAADAMPEDRDDPMVLSQREALKIAKMAVEPLIDLTLALLGDETVVKSKHSALALGGGLMMSKGYRGLLLDGLKNHGVEWGDVQVVDDAAGVGARGLAAVEFA